MTDSWGGGNHCRLPWFGLGSAGTQLLPSCVLKPGPKPSCSCTRTSSSWAILLSPVDSLLLARQSHRSLSCSLAIDIFPWERSRRLGSSSQAGTGLKLCCCLPECSRFSPAALGWAVSLPCCGFERKQPHQVLLLHTCNSWVEFWHLLVSVWITNIFLQEEVLGFSRVGASNPVLVHVFKYPVKAAIQSRGTDLF